MEFVNDLALGHGELTGLKIGAGAREVFPGFFREAGEGIVKP